MGDLTCSVEDCARAASRRGRCNMHYRRWLKHGSDEHVPRSTYRTIPPHERVLRRIEIVPSGCWEFQGSLHEHGYGLVRVGSKIDGTSRLEKTHRVVFEALVGPIPADLEIDHSCNNPSCCNPEHLEPVTHLVNMERAASRRTICINGLHPFADPNIVYLSSGYRTCKACLDLSRSKASVRRRQRRMS